MTCFFTPGSRSRENARSTWRSGLVRYGTGIHLRAVPLPLVTADGTSELSHWAYRPATSCGCVSRFSCRAALAAQHAVTTRGSHSATFPKSGKEKKEKKNVVITPNALYFPAFVYPRLRYFRLVSRCCLCNALLINLMSSSRGGGSAETRTTIARFMLPVGTPPPAH